jgi:hypothetical protein
MVPRVDPDDALSLVVRRYELLHGGGGDRCLDTTAGVSEAGFFFWVLLHVMGKRLSHIIKQKSNLV